MKKDADKKKISFQEKMRDYAMAHCHYPLPTKEDHLREIDLLEKQALKRNGEFHRSLSLCRSYFTFSYHNMNVNVGTKLVERGQNDYRTDTFVKVKFHLTNKLRLSLYIKDISFFKSDDITTYPSTGVTQYLIGLKKIETGNTDFDKKFIVKGNDEPLIQNLLKYDLQGQLIDLEANYFYPVVNITKKEFILIAQNRLYDEKEYDKLVETALTFLDRLRGLGLIEYKSEE